MAYSLGQLALVNAVSAGIIGASLWAVHRFGRSRNAEWRLGVFGLVAWAILQVWYWTRPDFDPAKHHPLHACDISSLVTGFALLLPPGHWQRRARTLVYFLAPFGFLAFVIPTGPVPELANPEFWMFWGYHIWIVLGFGIVVWIADYRPSRPDYLFVVGFAMVYFAVMWALGWRLGWNYGYLGPEGPPFFLGGWPWHAPVMLVIANIALFGLWRLGDRGGEAR